MKDFELSPDCILEKSAKVIATELLKGSFVVGCDYRNKELILENVFHYTKSQRRYEIYTLFPNKDNTKRLLKLDAAVIIVDPKNVMSDIARFMEMHINLYDVFVIDKYNNVSTDVVYDKYGGSTVLD